MKRYTAYTDGSFDMDSQIGASAVVILDSTGDKIYERAKARRVEYDPDKKQRSPEQELGAAIMAVMSVPDGCELFIHSDSQYVVRVLSGAWRANTNLGLIDRYQEEVRKRHLRVQFFWVRGHAGDPWNEYADRLCVNMTAAFRSTGVRVKETKYKDYD